MPAIGVWSVKSYCGKKLFNNWYSKLYPNNLMDTYAYTSYLNYIDYANRQYYNRNLFIIIKSLSKLGLY